MKKEVKFEDALKELEVIVEDLETGDVTLEKSRNKVEEGMQLVKFCSGKLEEVEKKIEIIVQEKKGSFHKEPFGDKAPKDIPFSKREKKVKEPVKELNEESDEIDDEVDDEFLF